MEDPLIPETLCGLHLDRQLFTHRGKRSWGNTKLGSASAPFALQVWPRSRAMDRLLRATSFIDSPSSRLTMQKRTLTLIGITLRKRSQLAARRTNVIVALAGWMSTIIEQRMKVYQRVVRGEDPRRPAKN